MIHCVKALWALDEQERTKSLQVQAAQQAGGSTSSYRAAGSQYSRHAHPRSGGSSARPTAPVGPREVTAQGLVGDRYLEDAEPASSSSSTALPGGSAGGGTRKPRQKKKKRVGGRRRLHLHVDREAMMPHQTPEVWMGEWFVVGAG